MKKRVALIAACILAVSAVVTGCGNKISNEYVSLEGYKGVEITEMTKPEETTDEEVDQYIDLLLSQGAEEIEITDRAVQEGDVAYINYVGKMDGEEFEGGTAEEFPLEIGSGQFIEGFEESVIGHTIGETYDWDGSFPEEYPNNPDFAGKPVTFTITVNSIKERQLPELTDEFVQTLSEKSKTVEEFKAELKELLTDNRNQQYEAGIQDAAWQAVLEKATINKYPEDEIQKEMDATLKQWTDVAEEQGMTYEDFVAQQTGGMPVEDFENEMKEEVKNRYKNILVVEAIAEAEKLEPSDKEFKERLEEFAKENGFPDVDTMKQYASEEDLHDMILQEIVIEWVADNAKQVPAKDDKK